MGNAIVSGGVINMEGVKLMGMTLSDGTVNRNGMNDRYASGSGNAVTLKGIYNITSSNELRLTVSNGGLVTVSDATVTNGTIGSGGVMLCGPNTQLSSQTVSSDGVLTVAGAKATSRLTMEAGSELNFNLSGHSPDDFMVWFDGMSYFTGATSPCVTVDASQATGDYVLAASNVNWISSLSIQNANGDCVLMLYTD